MKQNKNYGHITVQSWLHINEFAEIVKFCRHAGSTSTKPGQLLRQYIQATIPLINQLLDTPEVNTPTNKTLAFLREAGIKSEQLVQERLSTNLLKALVEESLDDADFKNWRRYVRSPESEEELQHMLEENLSKHTETDDEK